MLEAARRYDKMPVLIVIFWKWHIWDKRLWSFKMSRITFTERGRRTSNEWIAIVCSGENQSRFCEVSVNRSTTFRDLTCTVYRYNGCIRIIQHFFDRPYCICQNGQLHLLWLELHQPLLHCSLYSINSSKTFRFKLTCLEKIEQAFNRCQFTISLRLFAGSFTWYSLLQYIGIKKIISTHFPFKVIIRNRNV